MLRKIDFSGYARRYAERLCLSGQIQLSLRLRLKFEAEPQRVGISLSERQSLSAHRAAQPQIQIFCVTSDLQ